MNYYKCCATSSKNPVWLSVKLPACDLLTKVFRARILWATPRLNFNILLYIDIQQITVVIIFYRCGFWGFRKPLESTVIFWCVYCLFLIYSELHKQKLSRGVALSTRHRIARRNCSEMWTPVLSFREVHSFHRNLIHFPGGLVARWACVSIILECRQGKCSRFALI